MKLPNCEAAYIPIEKLTSYLLSEIHKMVDQKQNY